MSPEGPEDRETVRTEAFSDGVFAIAITLLALEIPRPAVEGGPPLSTVLLNAWPTFFALVTSFVTILIMWMNHHNLFKYIRRVDRRLMILNGLLLMFVTLTPFTSALVAEHMLTEDARTAAGIYTGMFVLLSFVWNGLWRYASNRHRLLGRTVTDEQVRTITRQYYVAPLSYGAAFVLSLVSGLLGVAVVFLVAAFYAITATIGRETEASRVARA